MREVRRRSEFVFYAAVGLAMAAALWLRWSTLTSQSLWMDEGYTVWISQFSPRQIWYILRDDTSPPLYYFFVHYWRALFGSSEFCFRSLSALLGTLSLPLVYLVARKVLLSGTAVAVAVGLYAVSFYQIWYAQEVRCYSLLGLLSIASVYLVL